jgi:putative ABC transport system permease protein
VRSFLTAAGLGAATSAIIAAGFMGSSLNHIIDLAFNQSYRQDAMILFARTCRAPPCPRSRACPA